MEKGTVRWFDELRGYGFIRRPNNIDVFFHGHAILGSAARFLNDGDMVQFFVERSWKGLQAHDVALVENENSIRAGEQNKNVDTPPSNRQLTEA